MIPGLLNTGGRQERPPRAFSLLPIALFIALAGLVLSGCVGPKLLTLSDDMAYESALRQVLEGEVRGLERLFQAIAFLEKGLYPDHKEALEEILQSELKALEEDESQMKTLAALHQAYHERYPIPDPGPQSGDLDQGLDLSRGSEEAFLPWVQRVTGVLLRDPARLEFVDQEAREELLAYARDSANWELMQLIDPAEPGSGFDPTYSVRASVTVLVDEGISLRHGVGSPQVVVGSGFFIDNEGHILTNYHVIQSQVDPAYKGTSKLTVRLYSDEGRASAPRVPARVIGWDEVLDLALLKTEAPVPAYVSLSHEASIRPGQRVSAIGSPGGLEHTVSSGIVSALGRRFLQLGQVFQVDIPINPGNSGGPVFDERGMVVGVVFAGIQQFDGVNFVIPAPLVLKVLPSLYKGGQIQHSWIGVSVYERRNRLFVSYVAPGSPLAKLPIRPGDEILSLNSESVRSLGQAQDILMDLELEELVVLGLRSGEGQEYALAINTTARPVLPFASILGDALASRWLGPLFGMEVSRLSNELGSPRFSIDQVYPGSVADEAGLSEHDSFRLMKWIYDREEEVAAIQIVIERRFGGYVPEGLQLAVYIAVRNFI